MLGHLNYNFGQREATSSDLLNQAKSLVRRMKKDKSISFKSDWKFLTISIGINDLCSKSCLRKNGDQPLATSEFVRNVVQALEYLQEELPHTYVNLILPPGKLIDSIF